jgi:hypothetical protein
MARVFVSITICALGIFTRYYSSAQDLINLANAELRMNTVCDASATVGIAGSSATTDLMYNFLLDAIQAQQNDVTVVERSRLDEVLAEHELSESPLIDPSTAVATDQLIGAKFLVWMEGDITSLPTTVTAQMMRVDTQEIVYGHSFPFDEPDGLEGLWDQLEAIAEDLANIAESNNYDCPRRGVLSYQTSLEGNDWKWDVSGYFDVLLRDEKVIIRHVALGNTVGGLLLSATLPPFPAIPVLEAPAQFDPGNPESEPIAYMIQFQRPSSPAPKHKLLFAEPPNPILNTGRQNELEFNHFGAIALGQWMRRKGNPSLILEASVTGSAVDMWSVPVGQGQMVLTWRLD